MALDLKEFQRHLIIDLIKQRRFLYDRTHPNYKNVKVKKKAWNDIAKLSKAPESSIRIFWRYMRNEYQRYMRAPANKRRNFHYFPKLTFLEGFTKDSKNNTQLCNNDKDIVLDNSSNSLNQQISYMDESDDYGEYNDEIKSNEYHLMEEYITDYEEPAHEEIIISSQNGDEPTLCNNDVTHATKEYNVATKSIDKSSNNLCDTINSLLTKQFQTEEDDNDLFLKMIGKKMKSLPLTVKNRLQERFLQEVNQEILKLNENPK